MDVTLPSANSNEALSSFSVGSRLCCPVWAFQRLLTWQWLFSQKKTLSVKHHYEWICMVLCHVAQIMAQHVHGLGHVGLVGWLVVVTSSRLVVASSDIHPTSAICLKSPLKWHLIFASPLLLAPPSPSGKWDRCLHSCTSQTSSQLNPGPSDSNSALHSSLQSPLLTRAPWHLNPKHSRPSHVI